MDRKQLEFALLNFKSACVERGAIQKDGENKHPAFAFDEIYGGVFIVNVMVENEWLDRKYHPNALKELIELLYETTDVQTRESILTLRLCKTSFPHDSIEYDTLDAGRAA